MAVRIQTLGAVRVERDGRTLDRLPARRVRLGLLVHLAVERTSLRDTVMGLFWPDRPPERARHLLSQTLYELRQDLGEGWIRTAGESLEVADHVVVDVGELESAAAAGDHARVVALYHGPFLGGTALGGTRELEGWVDGVQSRVSRLHRDARLAALDDALAAGNLDTALQLARGWVALEPMDDEAQHRLIELLAATGDRIGALRQYDRYEALVQAELELEPLEETQALIERIREGEAGQRSAGTGVVAPAPIDSAPAAPPPSTSPFPPGGGRPSWRRPMVAAVGLLLLVSAAVAGWAVRPGARVGDTFPPRRIAVLFFSDRTADGSLRSAADGFTDALIHELNQVDGLEIVSRAAVEPYRMRTPPLDSLARRLRAGTFVEGSLTRVAGDSVQVMFTLVDGPSGTQLFSGTATEPGNGLGALTGSLPDRAARLIRERLGRQVGLREARGGTESEAAWRLVQRAQVVVEEARALMTEDLEAALALLDRTDSLLAEAAAAAPSWPEPVFRRGHAELLRASYTAEIPGQREPVSLRRAMAHFDRALELDPRHVPALERRGVLHFDLSESAAGLAEDEASRLRARAEADLRLAVELDDRRAVAWWGLSRVLRRRGSFAEAKQAARRALAADAFLEVPEAGLFQLFHTSIEREEHEEAAEWCDELRERHPEHMRRVQCELILRATAPVLEPDPARGWALVDSMVAMGTSEYEPAYRGWASLYVAKALVRAGLPDSARAVLRRAVPGPTPGWAAYDAAHLCLMLGDIPESLGFLQEYLAANPEQASYLQRDWWFRDLHGDPRFRALVEGRGALPRP